MQRTVSIARLLMALALASAPTLVFADAAAVCKQRKAKAAASKTADLFKAFGANSRKDQPDRLAVDLSKAQSKFTSRLASAENKGGCLTTGDAPALEAKVDVFVADVVAKVSIRRGQEFQVNSYTTDSQYVRDVAMDADGNFVVVWAGEDDGPDGVLFQLYDSAGVPVGTDVLVSPAVDTGAVVAYAPDGSFIVVRSTSDIMGGDVMGQLHDTAGVPIGGEFPVNSYVTGRQSRQSVSVDGDGNFVVVWESRQFGMDIGQDGDGQGIFGQRLDSSGAPIGGEFQINTYTTFDQERPSVASSDDGAFVVVWEGIGPPGLLDGREVFARRYDTTGGALGPEFRVNSYTTGFQTYPGVAAAGNGDFVVVWESRDQDGEDEGIFGQRFYAGGNPLGSEFQVNTFTRGPQFAPDVSATAAGRFLVVWGGGESLPQPFHQDGDSTGIFAQHYDADGERVGTEFQVNTYTTDTQRFPRVALSPDGGAVVVWNSFAQDGSSGGVFAQRYDLEP
jgi:hypothetical protein